MRGVLLGHAALSGVVVGDYGGFYVRWDENQQGGSGADGGGRGGGSRARRPRPLAPRPRLPQNDLCTFNQRAGVKTSGGPGMRGVLLGHAALSGVVVGVRGGTDNVGAFGLNRRYALEPLSPKSMRGITP